MGHRGHTTMRRPATRVDCHHGPLRSLFAEFPWPKWLLASNVAACDLD
ncbi:hypothetical protein [Alloactinosynnema sp. L-07]|nr:hypothetical protein [Alloactinosynnema sp. L-07]